MRDLPVYLAIAGLFVMGNGATAKPRIVAAQFGILDLTAAGRNEVRAVYGGFGVQIAVALLVALQLPALRAGILVAVLSALGGMAGGRAVFAVIDLSFVVTPPFVAIAAARRDWPRPIGTH